MKIKVWCNNGASIHSRRQEVIEIPDDEWADMSEEERNTMAREWVDERLDWGWEEA
jgi:hypothetical protein